MTSIRRRYSLIIFTRSFFLALALGISSTATWAFVDLDQTTLARHPTWLALLHFDQGGTLGSRRSAVLSPEFFISSTGRFDPLAELTATLQAFTEPATEKDPHTLCAFPARVLWLKDQLSLSLPEQMNCELWNDWSGRHRGQDIGLIFATGYLGNPASFFGHLLFHLGEAAVDADGHADLLDRSLNFGAEVPPGEGMILYMFNGLFGRYKAQFSDAPFFANSSVYVEREMRDLWYYRLNLSQVRQELLLAHLFEIKGMNFTYRFLDENCASRIARTLSLVTDQPLISDHALWVSPEDVIRSVAKASVEGEALVGGYAHRPSRRRIAENSLSALSSLEVAAALAVFPDIQNLSFHVDAYQILDDREKLRVISALQHYLNSIRPDYPENLMRVHEQVLLVERLRHDASQQEITIVSPTPIHEATPASRIGVGALKGHPSALLLSYRPVQYDLLGSDDSRQPDAELVFADLTLALDDNSVWLQELVLLSIANLHATSIKLPGTSSMAWQVYAALEPADLSCKRCRDLTASYLAGYAQRRQSVMGFALIGFELNTGRHRLNQVNGIARLGLMADLGSRQRSLLTVEALQGSKGADSRRLRFGLEHSVEINSSREFRLNVKRQARDESTASLTFYRYF